VAAGRAYGLDLSGTMAHSYVLRFDDESAAFATYARDFPGRTTLLIDTYDTEEGARRFVRLAPTLRAAGALPRAVRLDSGDLGALARSVRTILDEGGLADVSIFASGDLDEYRITELLAAGAPIDGFGVGTQLGTSGDSPHLGVVYKLVEDVNGAKAKLSPGTVTLPGRKQVHRVVRDGCYDHDVIALVDEPPPPESRPLLEPVMRRGRRTGSAPALAQLRARAAAASAALPARWHDLEAVDPPYAVRVSAGLAALAARVSTPPAT
jgi:nicotinate phosphoribosyltransferase